MIILNKKYLLILYTILLLSSSSYADQFTYRIKPVLLSYSSEGTLEASFGIACNGTFTGIAYFMGSDRRTLRVGAIERIGTKLCAGFERTRTMILDEIDTTSYTPQSITAGQAGQRILYYRIEQIRNTPLTTNRSLLQISYEASCHPHVGILFAKSRPAVGEAAIISMAPTKSKVGTGECQTQLSLIKMRLVTQGQTLTLDPMNLAPNHLENSYRIKTRLIEPSSLQVSSTAGVAFKYSRLCNEAPIGMAISKKENGSMGISMIVANYYNDPCIRRSKLTILSSYSVGNIKLDPSKTSPNTAIKLNGKILRIVRPNQYAIQPLGGINIKFLDGCQSSQAVILGDGGTKEIFLGVIQNATSTGCKNKLEEVSWYLPYVQLQTSSKVRPLAMWGTI